MEQNDVQLIQRILQGDQEAFSPLVKKYQQGVHALVWRKIGDFHIAQEITQDAFLQAYRKLGTLKNPTQFSGWLYVIAANLCRSWFRKNRMPVPESLDATEANEVDRVSYSQYVAEKQEADADETRREVVKKLLQKLPESERIYTLAAIGNTLFAGTNQGLYRLDSNQWHQLLTGVSDAGDELIPLQGVPAFEPEPPPDRASDRLRLSRKIGLKIKAFAVRGETFYAKYQEKLYKWHPGNTEWTDTGLDDLDFLTSILAVSGETVYISKPRGTLFQSLDGGNSWKDITTTLPSGFARFKEITFIDSSVCVATDKGVFTSHTGEHWRVITDKNRMPPVIEKFATDGRTLYGVGKNGAYRLDAAGDWNLISSEVPNGWIQSLVISNNRLYIATHSDGIFHISLEEQRDIANSF